MRLPGECNAWEKKKDPRTAFQGRDMDTRPRLVCEHAPGTRRGKVSLGECSGRGDEAGRSLRKLAPRERSSGGWRRRAEKSANAVIAEERSSVAELRGAFPHLEATIRPPLRPFARVLNC
jgi:hypothetical protein